MKVEEIGMCPCCFQGKGPAVGIYANRKDNGDLTGLYIFGDDDFDVPKNNQDIKDVKISDDKKSVIEIVCPRCKEHIAVNIPIIKQLFRSYTPLEMNENFKPLTVANSQEKGE